MVFVVVYSLRNELFDVPIPADQSDLKPADAKSLAKVFKDEEKAAAGQQTVLVSTVVSKAIALLKGSRRAA